MITIVDHRVAAQWFSSCLFNHLEFCSSILGPIEVFSSLLNILLWFILSISYDI